MESKELLRDNLIKSLDRVLLRIEDMREHGLVLSTPNSGAHTLWTLGHLAYIEEMVIREFMLGESNPLAHWAEIFDGLDMCWKADDYPSFDEVLETCRETRKRTLGLLDSLAENDLDKQGAKTPKGWESTFGTYRLCMQYAADHWYMHRGQLADARHAAGIDRMWV